MTNAFCLSLHRFDDCLRLGRRINEGPYLLPDPEILRKGPYSGIKAIPRPDLQIDILPNIKSTMDISNSFPERSSVFRDLKVLLSEDLGVSELHRETMETLVYRGGGCCTSELEEADILVCQYRDSSAFRLFASQSKTVGNLSWLYHVISQDSWSNPMRRLLHFPIARDGLPGFKDFRISLSNYNGEARVYLENLAKAAGCEFTKTMKIENTHLITAHLKSEKCEAAKEWNINIVNHLWLEESYAKWQVQSLANPRFTHFPPRTNLGEVVGQTPVDKKALECFFHPKSTKVTSRNGYNRKPVSGPERGRNAAKMAREGQCEEAATPSKTRVLPTHNPKGGSSGTSYGGNVEEKGVTSAQGSAAQTPSSAQDEARGKENETPPTGTRSAKERAAARLHNMSSDIALYEKERKRVGGVLFGGKKSEEDLVSSRSLKRPASAKSLRDDASSPAERQSKRPKKTKTTPLVKLLVTGYAKWAEDSRSFEKDRVSNHQFMWLWLFLLTIMQDRLRKLGIVLKDGYADCDLVAAPKIMRTRKFICAMANGSILISTDFVEQCLIQNKLLDPEDYPLKDPDGEERFNMTLSEALARAKENNGQLLEGQVIYATENVHGGFDTYKAIVEANGGSCILFKGRAGLKVPKLKETNSQPDQQFIYLISAPEGSDLKLWPKFQEIADEAQRVARIVKTEWMLDLALSQQLHWNLGYSFLPNET